MAKVKEFIFRVLGESKGIDQLNRKTKSLNINMAHLAVRAALVIPVWAGLRTAILGPIRALGDATRAFSEFDQEMARVSTVTRASSSSIGVLEKNIINFAASSTASFKDTASAVYALGSAGLSASEQLAGFESIMNTAIGTGGNVEQTAKLMAGAYNVFGKSLKDATTLTEKFAKIGDIISYTYSQQQVELSELANALGYVASAGSQIDIQFEELVTTIGVLNTGLLKSSKSGTALVNAFIKVAQNTSKLRDIGIAIDPSKPLKFIDVMEQLNKKFGENKLSVEGLNKIVQIFGIRGGRAVQLLLTNFSFFKKSLDESKNGAEGFAEVMKRIQQDTIPGLGQKIKNTFQAIWFDVLNDFETPFKSMLKNISKALDEFRANQKTKGLLGETTLPQQISRVGGAGGAGLAALLLGGRIGGRGQIGSTLNFPGFVSQADIAKRAFSLRLQSGKVTQGGIKGLSDQQLALRQVALTARSKGQFNDTAFRGLAQQQLLAETGKAAGGFGNTLKALGGTFLTTVKVATLAYAGLKLVQSGLNAFAPDNPSVQAFNDAMGSLEQNVGKAAVKIIEFVDEMIFIFSVLIPKAIENLGGIKNFAKQSASNVVGGSATSGVLGVAFKGLKGLYDSILKGVTGAESYNKAQKAGKSFVEKILEPVEEARAKRDAARALRTEERGRLTGLVGSTQKTVDFFKLATESSLGNQKLVESTQEAIKRENDERVKASLGVNTFTDRISALDQQIAENNGNETKVNELLKEQLLVYQGLDKYLTQTANDFKDLQVKEGAEAYFNEIRNALGITPELLEKGLSDANLEKVLTNIFTQSTARVAQTTQGTGGVVGVDFDKAFATRIEGVFKQKDINLAKALGLSEANALQEELNLKLQEVNAEHSLTLELSDLTLANKQKLVELSANDSKLQNEIVDLLQKATDIEQKRLDAIIERGKEIKSVFQNAFKDLLTGDLVFADLGKRIADGFNEAMAGQFSEILANAFTGITGVDSAFGGIFQGLSDAFASPIQKLKSAHIDGNVQSVPIIKNAIISGWQEATSGKGTTSQTGASGGFLGGLTNVLGGAGSLVTNFLNTPINGQGGSPAQRQAYAAKLRAQGMDFEADQVLSANQSNSNMGMTTGQVLGGAASAGLAAYSGYQAAGGGGWGAARAALSGVGTALMTFGGPIGMLAGGAMLLGSMFIRGQKDPGQPENTSNTEQFSVTSRLDISNRELQYINRNLVALRTEMSYILSESAYFSENRNLGDEFAIHSMRLA